MLILLILTFNDHNVIVVSNVIFLDKKYLVFFKLARVAEMFCKTLFLYYTRSCFQVSIDNRGKKSLKLGDFGLAQKVTGPLFTVCGTPTYVAPEVLAEDGYGLKVSNI